MAVKETQKAVLVIKVGMEALQVFQQHIYQTTLCLISKTQSMSHSPQFIVVDVTDTYHTCIQQCTELRSSHALHVLT